MNKGESKALRRKIEEVEGKISGKRHGGDVESSRSPARREREIKIEIWA